jgi:hypothetical protein
VAGRNRTCGALRFRQALYPLSYGHMRMSGQGWNRTSDLLFVRQALVPTELLALVEIRDKESNLDLQVQSLASCRLDDPGALRAGTPAPKRPPASRRRLSVHSTCAESTQSRLGYVSSRSCRDDVFQATRPTLRPWIVTPALREPAKPSFVEELWSPVRAHSAKKALVNQGAKCACPFLRVSARDLISLRRGLDSN